ncbi:MAG: SDR family NAD(P)-dependent oxidoreductase, partial [SAR86 cluster bacterium]|nr:SDR family NAD(P)-dependent oxidoreductase [SAR86 cluster bacterium]
MSKFKQQVAAITGAGSGMGRALAQSLAQQGCHLAIADINQKGLNETVSSITDQLSDLRAVKITTHIVDVAD